MKTDFLFIFTAVAFFIWTIRSIFYWISEWQHFSPRLYKEGLRPFIKHTFSYFLSPSSIISWIGLIASLFILVSDFPLFYIQLLVTAIFFGKASSIVNPASLRSIKRSHLSVRNIVIAVFTLFFTAILFSFPLTEKYIWILVVDRILFLIILCTLFIYTFPGEILDDLQGRRAQRKRTKLAYLNVIAIIGNDSSEIAALTQQILRKKMNVVALTDDLAGKGSVAHTLVTKVDRSTEVFIVPMSPKNISDVVDILTMIKPDKLVISSVSSEKEIKNILTIAANSMAKKGIVIAPSTFSSTAVKIIKKRKIIFYNQELTSSKGGISINDISQKKESLNFTVSLPTRTFSIKVPFIGMHHLSYLLPVITTADILGMTGKELVRSLDVLSPLADSSVIHKLRSGVIIVDASGVERIERISELLEYSKLYKGKRIVIFGIDESYSAREIKILGKEMSDKATQLYIMNSRYQQSLRKAIRSGGKCKINTSREKDIVIQIQDRTTHGDVVIFLGRQTEDIVDLVVRSGSTSD